MSWQVFTRYLKVRFASYLYSMLFRCFLPQSSPKPLVTNKDFPDFLTKITVPTNSTEIFCKLPSPQVNVVCLDLGEVLHDFFQVTEINNIDLEVNGWGHLLFRSTFFHFVTRVLARIVVNLSSFIGAKIIIDPRLFHGELFIFRLQRALRVEAG